jgi:hypothetical protein
MHRPIDFLADVRLQITRAVVILAVVATVLPVGAKALDLRRFSASGTHLCDGAAARQCVVSGSAFQNCIDAENSLKVQDCCRTAPVCSHDPKTGETKCDTASTSTKFTLDYCVASRRFH